MATVVRSSKTALFNLEEFIARAKSSGFARQNKFEVFLTAPRGLPLNPLSKEGPQLSILNCELASFPAMNILTRQLRAQGPAYQRPVGIDFSGDGIPLTFVVDQSMGLKAFFDAWLFKIVNPFSAEVSYKDQYSTSVKITQFNELEEAVYTITLIDAFPRSVSLLDLSSSAQNSFHKLTVNFAFRKWISSHEWYQSLDLAPTTDVSGNRPLFNDPYKIKRQPRNVPPTSPNWPVDPTGPVGPNNPSTIPGA